MTTTIDNFNEKAMEEGRTVPLEEPATTTNNTEKLPAGTNQKKKWIFLVGVVAVIALALGLGLGLGLDRDDDTTNTTSEIDMAVNQRNQTGSNGGTSTGTAEGTSTGTAGGTSTGTAGSGGSTNPNDVLFDDGVHLPILTTEAIRNTYESCGDLQVDLRKLILYTANRTIEQNIQWMFHNNYNYGGGGGVFTTVEGGVAEAAPEMDASAGGAATAGSAPARAVNEDSFGTNNQVEGVDEADVLKSNGVQAFAAYGQEIVELDVDQVTVLSRTKLPFANASTTDSMCGGGGSVLGMLLIEERLVVIANEYGYYGCPIIYAEGDVAVDTTSSTPSDPLPIVSGNAATKVYIYDTNTMSLLSTEVLNGDYHSSRSIGNSVYVLTSAWVNLWEFTQHLDPYNQEIFGSNSTEEEYRTTAEAQAQLQVDDFASRLASELDCDTIQQIALFQNTNENLEFSSGLESLVSVHSFDVTDIASTLETRTTAVPSGSWNLYASSDYLVLAGQGYQVGVLAREGDDASTTDSATEKTYIVVYKLDGPSVSDVMVGSVEGFALNQFSMDQSRQIDSETQTEKDYLRIATCTGQRWIFSETSNIWEPAEDPLCQVSVLEINENMPIVGNLKNVGKEGERIYAVRFQGDRGYVVTFQETDPFYTLNLSDPKNPQVVGELEIPGYSNYLHPIDGDMLLGVGQSVVDGITQGLQVSLYDVSDFANPVRLFNFIEESGSYSDAQYDHLGFRFLPESGLLIIPFSSYGDGTNGKDGFQLYAIDKTTGIESYLTIEHGSGNFYDGGCWSSYGYLSPRSIVKDGGLRTFKGHTIHAYNLSDRTAVGTPIDLDANLAPQDCSPYYFVGF